jgi:hypothetical protein
MNISFSLTTRQVRGSTPTNPLKDVTRRMGWLKLKAGQRLWACVKCMGLKKGELPERIREIEVVSVRREKLRAMTDDLQYGYAECKREGFTEMTPRGFVTFFCESHAKCTPESVVTRIEFKYVP